MTLSTAEEAAFDTVSAAPDQVTSDSQGLWTVDLADVRADPTGSSPTITVVLHGRHLGPHHTRRLAAALLYAADYAENNA